MSKQEQRQTSHPGIRLYQHFSPCELQLMRLSVFVREMKISTIPQEKITPHSADIRPNREL